MDVVSIYEFLSANEDKLKELFNALSTKEISEVITKMESSGCSTEEEAYKALTAKKKFEPDLPSLVRGTLGNRLFTIDEIALLCKKKSVGNHNIDDVLLAYGIVRACKYVLKNPHEVIDADYAAEVHRQLTEGCPYCKPGVLNGERVSKEEFSSTIWTLHNPLEMFCYVLKSSAFTAWNSILAVILLNSMLIAKSQCCFVLPEEAFILYGKSSLKYEATGEGEDYLCHIVDKHIQK